MPNVDWPSFTCRLLTSAKVSIGDNPLFSARVRGIESKADANARMAYCSIDGIYAWTLSHPRAKNAKSSQRTSSAALATAIEELMSAAPPP